MKIYKIKTEKETLVMAETEQEAIEHFYSNLNESDAWEQYVDDNTILEEVSIEQAGQEPEPERTCHGMGDCHTEIKKEEHFDILDLAEDYRSILLKAVTKEELTDREKSRLVNLFTEG